MGAALPRIAREEFDRRLTAVTPEPLAASCRESLYLHYQELRRWNPTLSLVGPGTAEAVVERHYGESLAALALLAPRPGTLLDLGSGAGFPGVVLAAARPGLRVVLVEARERKWAFLMSACRKASLPCACLNARVTRPLPAGLPDMLDVLTLRALKLPRAAWEDLLRRLNADGKVLRWTAAESEALPVALRPGRRVPLAGSARREIVELLP